MKKFTTSLLLVCLAAAFTSCGKKEDPAPEPIKQPVRQKTAPAPVVDANPTAGWRVPQDDLNLPTDAQTNEGADSSIGTGTHPVSTPDNSPSVAVTPPSAPSSPATPAVPSTPKKPLKKEDQLDPQ